MAALVNRRQAIGMGVAAAGLGVAAAGLGAQAHADEAQTEQTPSFLNPPETPSDIVAEYDCDVLVIGMGLSGIAAAREAAEGGARVLVLEKQPEDTYSVISMAGDFGVVGSQIQKDLGIEWAPKDVILNEYLKETGGRCDSWLLSYWYDHSGEDFDWFIADASYELVGSVLENQKTDNPNFLRPKCFPKLEGYDYTTELYPYFHGTLTTLPNMGWACAASREDALALGMEVVYGAEAELLAVEDGKVVGAYAKTDAGHIKVTSKATVLATGDYSGNTDMRHYYAPWADSFKAYSSGQGTGHLMGIWAGGKMEDGPHAPMTHVMGNVLGVDSFLQLNNEGKRFMNEDIPGQNLANEYARQPDSSDPELAEAGVKAWQIFDSSWPEQIGQMPDGHGYTNHFVPDDQADQYSLALSGYFSGYTTQQMVDDGATAKADTIEELAEAIGLPVDVVTSEVTRYNELCEAGFDEDFGKTARRLFPVVNPPFYACKMKQASMLVMIGGLECDHSMRVTAAQDGAPIEGLYACGNTMGGRLLVDYPVVVAGFSLATALTFGRLAGKNASEMALA